MMNFIRETMTLSSTSQVAVPQAHAQALCARLNAGRIGSRLALYKGGFSIPIPPFVRPDVYNHTSCQSPGRGRPH